MICFSHILNTPNTGDTSAGPYLYFDFGEMEVYNYSDRVPDGGTVVYGGGTMVNWLATSHTVLPKAKKVIWGAGSSRHGKTEPWPDPEGFDLIGTREWTPERESMGLYAPCPSCMLPLFDEDHTVIREAVRFINGDRSIQQRYPMGADDLPTMDNREPVERIIRFLGSSEIVVTNSYHGCWFALLLGCRVVCVPYSSKFYGFKYPVVMSENGGDDWKEKSKVAPIYRGALEDARDDTIMFYRRVCGLISDG